MAHSALLPLQAATLGVAYTLEACRRGSGSGGQGVEQAVANGRPNFLATVVACLNEAYLLAGRLEDARQRAAALDLARPYQQRGNQAWALWLLGEAARQPSPEGELAGPLPPGLTLAEELGMPPAQAHCHRGLGTLCDDRSAERGPCRVLRCYRSLSPMEMTFWIPETGASLAQGTAR